MTEGPSSRAIQRESRSGFPLLPLIGRALGIQERRSGRDSAEDEMLLSTWFPVQFSA